MVLSNLMPGYPGKLSPDGSPFNALDLMNLKGSRCLLVFDGMSVVGIISIRDLNVAVKDTLEDDIRKRKDFVFDTG